MGYQTPTTPSAGGGGLSNVVDDTSPQLGADLDTNGFAIDESKGSDVASATTIDLGAIAGNYANITGTTTITGLGTATAGIRRIVQFSGALTLTHNGTSLILPTGANITTAAGDVAIFISLGSGNWRCVSYMRASGESPASNQTINSEAAGSATLVAGELSTSTAQILNIVTSNAASQTITLPSAGASDVGKWFKIYNAGTHKMTVSSASTLNGDTELAVEAGCVAYINATGEYRLVGTGNPSVPVEFPVFEWTTDVATGDGKYYFRVPEKFNSWNITAVHAEVITAGTTGTTDIQIHNVTDAVDVLSTKLTIDSGETGSDTAATPAVINTSNDDVATNDLLRIDVDAISTTAPKGLLVTLVFEPA